MRLRRNLFALVALLSMTACSAVPADPLVYVTTAGKKYHLKNCRLKHGSKGIKLSEAKKKGYTPCAVCKPPR